MHRVAPDRPLIPVLQRVVLARDPEFCRYSEKPAPLTLTDGRQALHDYWFASDEDPCMPDDIFPLLRWGGQFVYAASGARRAAEISSHFAGRGFELIQQPTSVRRPLLSLPGRIGAIAARVGMPLGSKVHYFIARKVQLTRPREINERFTYHLQLSADSTQPTGYAVIKEVPSVERVVARLEQRFPEISTDVLMKRALKFTEKIFPTFLTREAAMLKILERHLPSTHANRVPRLLDLEKDQRGYVRKLRMTWLRNAVPRGRPLTQLEFARQSADLLHVLHEHAHVIHLDLRLDNFVITENGVGFVDFGSSVRVGEDLKSNALLSTLFEELMRTSEIQRMLARMTLCGSVTSPVLNEGYQKVDKAVDFFYLAVQINSPASNPDFLGLVQADASSEQAKRIKQITEEVLRPRNLSNPRYRSARDLLEALRTIPDMC